MRIDAHQHYWRIGHNGQEWPGPDLPQIHRDFMPKDLDAARLSAGVTRTVLVQSQPHDADTDWMLDLADRTPSIGAVVGWVDLPDPAAADRIAVLARHPKLRGIRPMLQALAVEWILQPAIEPAIGAMIDRGLVFDALIRPAHLPALTRFAAAHPRLQIVIDHAAKPDIAQDEREPWGRDIAMLARLPNVACKISGLVTEAGSAWSAGDLRFYVDHLIDCFGPERLVWGSDWPVLLLASDYPGWLRCCERLFGHLPAPARAAIFGTNARRIYRVG